MTAILVVAVFVALLASLAYALKLRANLQERPEKSDAESPDYPFRVRDSLFTPAERSFLGVLYQAVGEKARVFGKIRVADVLNTQQGLPAGDRAAAFNRISGKHFDFILCRNDDLSVICAIELDDSSHRSERRQDRDEFLNGACEAAGLALLRVPVQSSYTIDKVKQLVAPYFDGAKITIVRPEPPPRLPMSNTKVCPKCASNMTIKVAKRGANIGEEFWACSAYPKCRHTEALGRQIGP